MSRNEAELLMKGSLNFLSFRTNPWEHICFDKSLCVNNEPKNFFKADVLKKVSNTKKIFCCVLTSGIKFSKQACQKGNERGQHQGFIEDIDLNAFMFSSFVICICI